MSLIEATGLGKSYGSTRAVDGLDFTVRPGSVTGFLGPNGSGKSTTMRLMLGLDHGEGRTTFDGRRFSELEHPMRHVGALLEAKPFHPTRRARDHLRMLAAANGISRDRVDEVLALVGLEVGRQWPSAQVQPRHGAAARHRRRAPGRPAHPAPRRAEQRTRPPGHHLAAHACSSTSPARAGRCSCPATSCRRWPCWPTSSSSSAAGGWSPTARWPTSSRRADSAPSS